VFNGGAFTERFELLGAETQLQRFFYRGKRTRTFEVSFVCELAKTRGGTPELHVSIQKNDVTVPDSVFQL